MFHSLIARTALAPLPPPSPSVILRRRNSAIFCFVFVKVFVVFFLEDSHPHPYDLFVDKTPVSIRKPRKKVNNGRIKIHLKITNYVQKLSNIHIYLKKNFKKKSHKALHNLPIVHLFLFIFKNLLDRNIFISHFSLYSQKSLCCI
jgi:hypothetical protein